MRKCHTCSATCTDDTVLSQRRLIPHRASTPRRVGEVHWFGEEYLELLGNAASMTGKGAGKVAANSPGLIQRFGL